MSLSLITELSDGLMEIYDEIGVPMTYYPLDTTIKPDKFGTLIPSYDTTKAFTANGLLNIEETPDADTSVVSERKDGMIAIVAQNFTAHGITPKAKDKVEVVDVLGVTQRFVVTGIAKTPGATNVGIPFLMTYLNVVYDTTLARE